MVKWVLLLDVPNGFNHFNCVTVQSRSKIHAMDLLTQNEVESIVEQCGYTNNESLKWTIDNYSSEIIGYLGEHLKLKIEMQSKGKKIELNLFLKCIPRINKWKAEYIRQSTFFLKEYAMLGGLFKHFQENQGKRKWRPKLLYIKEELFVFEDVSEIGYVMPNHVYTLSDEELMATVESLARFHAQSYIYEETKSKELARPYRIWEEYSDYLSEPINGQAWRDTGMRAAIDYLKEYSAYKLEPRFIKNIEFTITMLYKRAMNLMKLSSTYRNVVIHRDIWANNILLKKLDSGKFHALIVDFQTSLYSSPMLDLSSLLFFNTTKTFRSTQIRKVIDLYYTILSEELRFNGIDVLSIIDSETLMKAYDDSIIFGVTQAALLIPITAMSDERRRKVYGTNEKSIKFDVVSRSQEVIETARDDINYRNRVSDLLDDMVERFLIYHSSPISIKV